MLGQLKMYGRFASGLPGFLRRTITLSDAESIVRRGMENREANFLRLVERGVYANPRSPYLRLLRMARCEAADLRALVNAKGLETALRTLREAGVYVTFDELKGRQPIVRDGESFPVTTADFANPLLHRAFERESGGSTGAGTRVAQDLDHLAMQSAHVMLACDAHGLLQSPLGIWRGVLPDGSGIDNLLRSAHHGRIARRWFSPTRKSDPKPAIRFRLATYGTVLTGWACGVRLPWPEMVPIEEAAVVAHWLAEMLRAHRRCQISLTVSRALQVSVAARKAGLDLTGAVFMVGGEPPSAAKVAGIRACGAGYFPSYGFTEAGRLAFGCARPSTENDLHVLRDAFEVLPYARLAPGTNVTVDALNVTTLLFTTPQILLNAEIDDCGVVESRSCGCPLERHGYRLHVRDIYSYRKLTGEGATLVGTDMIDILERVLPAKFGGTPLDYQVMEEEDERGFTRLSLIVSPQVQLESEDAVIRTVLEELHCSSAMADVAGGLWSQAGTFRIKRMNPVWTGRGKLLPLYLARRAAGDGGAVRGQGA